MKHCYYEPALAALKGPTRSDKPEAQAARTKPEATNPFGGGGFQPKKPQFANKALRDSRDPTRKNPVNPSKLTFFIPPQGFRAEFARVVYEPKAPLFGTLKQMRLMFKYVYKYGLYYLFIYIYIYIHTHTHVVTICAHARARFFACGVLQALQGGIWDYLISVWG